MRDPDRNIVVTCGATEGMIVAMEALMERGSEVITFAPMYENYVLQSIAAGLELKTLEVREPDFGFTAAQLEALYSPRTAAVLLCNPCNPTGKVFTGEELETIADFAAAHDLLIFCDETYEFLVWPGHRHVSIGALPQARDRTVTVTSMGKTYSVTGWRVGYVVAEESLTNELRKMHDFHTVTAPHPFQIALAGALELPPDFYERLRAEYWMRKQVLGAALEQTGMTYYEPGGSYFLWCGYARLSDEDDARVQRAADARGRSRRGGGQRVFPTRYGKPAAPAFYLFQEPRHHRRGGAAPGAAGAEVADIILNQVKH